MKNTLPHLKSVNDEKCYTIADLKRNEDKRRNWIIHKTCKRDINANTITEGYFLDEEPCDKGDSQVLSPVTS